MPRWEPGRTAWQCCSTCAQGTQEARLLLNKQASRRQQLGGFGCSSAEVWPTVLSLKAQHRWFILILMLCHAVLWLGCASLLCAAAPLCARPRPPSTQCLGRWQVWQQWLGRQTSSCWQQGGGSVHGADSACLQAACMACSLPK
jgi:hypothetical protein